jgi:LysR family nitrogen assimilation transcriptional regulator
METRYLKSFLRTADLRSISRAAESLGIAQPSLSQQLLRLEDEVGFKLFNRTARGVIITEAGRIFQEHARRLLVQIDQALEDVQGQNNLASGQAVVALPYSISRLIGLTLVEAMIHHAPQTSVRLVEAPTGTIRGWLNEGRIDLGVLFDLGPIRHLSSRRLASEPMYLIGPAGAFGSPGETVPDIAFADLSAYPLITFGPQHGIRKFLDHEITARGHEYKVAHEIDVVPAIAGLVARGHGYAILPRTAVAGELTAGSLSLASIGGHSLRRSLSLVRNPNQVITHASARVEDMIIKIMASLIAQGVWEAEADAALS